MFLFYLAGLAFFSFLLIKSTELLVDALEHFSKSTALGKFALTSLLIASATSLPELFVCLAASLEQEQSLALGNILGANIANLTLVIGGATIIGGSLNVFGDLLKKDLLAVFLAALLPLILLLDNSLSRVDGLLLLLIFGVYNYSILSDRPKASYHRRTRILSLLNHRGTRRQIAWVFLAMAVLLFSADVIVKISENIASALNLPLILVGIFFVSVGTTLPELTFSFKAVRKKQVAMVFGGVIGSLITNSTLILGLTALVNPIKVKSVQSFFLATVFYIIIFGLFWFFIRTKRKLERWEAAVLIGVYVLFLFLELYKAKVF